MIKNYLIQKKILLNGNKPIIAPIKEPIKTPIIAPIKETIKAPIIAINKISTNLYEIKNIYISNGAECNVKYQIDKHKHKLETLFFDRLITSMISVIEILSCNDINNILYFDNIIKDTSHPIINNNSRINIKSLNRCTSIHDLKINYSNKDILNFIEKYKRRFNRIIEYIKSNHKIYFIRFDKTNFIDNDTIQKFIKTILKINPNCNFNLILIKSYNNKLNNYSLSKNKHCLYIKLSKQNNIKFKYDWTTSYIDWKKIFLDIENNT